MDKLNRILNMLLAAAVFGTTLAWAERAVSAEETVPIAPLTPTTPAEGKLHDECIAGKQKCYIVTHDMMKALTSIIERQKAEIERVRKLAGKSCI